ncbi:MAG: Abi-alpha family protein, partial [Gammaproteobacteria bacterium]
MSDETEAIKEAAKATQEVAKTASNAIDAGREMGGFVSRFISGPLEQAVGIVEDKLRYIRWERQRRLIRRAEEYMREQGLSAPDKPIPLKNVVPLLEYATLEEDDTLQDMWARLLVNGTNESTGVNIERSFIEILAQLSPLEAQILQVIYALPFEATQHAGVVTESLPFSAKVAEEKPEKKYGDPTKEVKLALANLARIGCLKFPLTWGGG